MDHIDNAITNATHDDLYIMKASIDQHNCLLAILDQISMKKRVHDDLLVHLAETQDVISKCTRLGKKYNKKIEKQLYDNNSMLLSIVEHMEKAPTP